MSHNHAHGAEGSNPRLMLSIALTLAFVIAEAVAGYLAHSLPSCPTRGTTSAMPWPSPLVVGLRAASSRRHHADLWLSPGRYPGGPRKRTDTRRHRGVIIWEAVERFREPQPIHSGPMIWVALVAVVLNGVISLWLRERLRAT